MRILHLLHSEGIYGAERILLYLAREQQRSGLEPLLGSIRDPGTAQTPFEALAASWGLPVVQIRIAPRPTPGVVRSLLGTVRKLAPDVLHSHGYKPDIMLGLLPWRTRGPMLTTVHGWTAARPLSRLWLYERLDRLALRRVDLAVLVTRGMLQLAGLRGLPRRQVIENGIPPLAERLADLAAAGTAALPEELVAFIADAPTLVAIGRLSAEKGFVLLLAAFARARALAGAKLQLLIVGDGPQRAHLMRLIAELDLSAAVRLAGYVEGADRLLEHACGFVMSSLTEGMPLVLLEALQWRVPIVATAVGGIPDMLEQGERGQLVPPGDADALAAALGRIWQARATRHAARIAEPSVEAYNSVSMAEGYAGAYATIRERRS
jgi:glycosyltransferase involved in cell wall biosynthesis